MRPSDIRFSRSRDLRAALLGLLLLVPLALGLAGCAANTGGDPVLAARVNGRPITLALYQSILRLNMANAAASSRGGAPDWQSPPGRTRLYTSEQDALDTLINLELARGQLAKNHITIAPATRKQISDDFNSRVARLRESAKADPTNADLRALVDSLTPDVVNVLVDQEAIREALADKPLFPKAHLRAILVNSRADAENLKKQAEGGADFGQLARDHSADSTLASQGGELGTVYVGQATGSISQAVFGPQGSKQKYIIAPFQSQFLLLEATDRGMTPLKDVGEAQEQQGVYRGWLENVVRPATDVGQYVTTS